MSCQLNISSNSAGTPVSVSSTQKRKLVPLLPNTLKKPKASPPASSSTSPSSTSPSCSATSSAATSSGSTGHTPPPSSPLKDSTTTTSASAATLPPPTGKTTSLAKIINPSNLPYHTSSDQPKPKHLKSCSRCRKHKTKCNYIETAPHACSSCSKRGLVCQLEVVIPVKRSNIIKNLSNDIENLKNLVDELILKDKYLKSLCKQKGLKVEGLANIENCKRDLEFNNNMQRKSSSGSSHYEDDEDDDEDEEEDEDDEDDNDNEIDNENDNDNDNDNEIYNDNDIEDSENDYIYQKNPPTNYHSMNNILSKFESVITPPNSNSISPNLSDIEIDDLPAKSFSSKKIATSVSNTLSDANFKLYTLNDCCCFSHNEIKEIMNNFNTNYLPFIPIMDEITSIEHLFVSNKLLFWSIVYIVTANIDIYTSYIIKEVLSFLKNDVDAKDASYDPYNSLVAVLFLCCFPTKIKSTKFDIDDELDTCNFQWLESCKSKCLKYNYIEKYIDDNEKNNYKKNIWCVIFILGNFYGFRLGLKWAQPLDFILEESKDRVSYLGQLLNITILLSKLLDHFVFTNGGNNNNGSGNSFDSNDDLSSTDEIITTDLNPQYDDHLLVKSLSNWQFKLNRMKTRASTSKLVNSSLSSNLSISFDFLELIFTLFEPQNLNFPSQLEKTFTIAKRFFSNIENLNVTKCPIFLKISLEFVCLILTKLSYCPYFLNKQTNADLYINLFNKLIAFVDYNDTRFVFNTLMDFDSSVKLDSSLIDIFNMDSFKRNLMPGLINDLKKLNQRFKSIEINNSRIQKNKNIFKSKKLDYQSYSDNFNFFRSQVDLVIIYSNEILKFSNTEGDIPDASLSTSSILSKDELSDTNSIAGKSGKSNVAVDNVQFVEPVNMHTDTKIKSDLQLQQQLDDIDLFGTINWIN